MLAVGLLWSLGALQLANGSLLFTLGYVLGGVAFVAFAHLILSYPTGRLRPGDEWIVWAVLALVTVGPFVVTLVDPSPIPGCDDCPESAFLVADRSRARADGQRRRRARRGRAVDARLHAARQALPGGDAAAPARHRARLPLHPRRARGPRGEQPRRRLRRRGRLRARVRRAGLARADAGRVPRRHPADATRARGHRRPRHRARERQPAPRRARGRARRPVARPRLLVRRSARHGSTTRARR